MNRFICSYNMNCQNAFDDRRLVLIIRAENQDDALSIARNKIQETDIRDWKIGEIVETDNPIEALVVVRR
ncbi:hypothetical protein A9G14_04770 [Gilliamella apicola]|nr:hypothetical protein A9G14_04770 [Gilliamella apicola]